MRRMREWMYSSTHSLTSAIDGGEWSASRPAALLPGVQSRDRTEPCGTPACISRGANISSSTETLNFLSNRNDLIRMSMLTENCNWYSMYKKPGYHKASEAFSISKNTAAVNTQLLEIKVTWSVSLIYWSVVLWWTWQPNWPACSMLFLSTCLWSIFKTVFSNNFPYADRRLIGRKILGSCPVLVTLSLSLLLKRWKMWQHKIIVKKMCDMHQWPSGKMSEESMPSITRAFPSWSKLIWFWSSQGLNLAEGLSIVSNGAWTL